MPFRRVLFWSYSDDEVVPESVVVEQVMLFGNVDEIRRCIRMVGVERARSIFEERVRRWWGRRFPSRMALLEVVLEVFEGRFSERSGAVRSGIAPGRDGMRMDLLSEEMRAVLEALAERKEMARFVLVGGTAIALYIGHRRSEDLDFFCVEERLPRRRISGLLDALNASGFSVEGIAGERAGGVAVFGIGGVKVDFVAYGRDFVYRESAPLRGHVRIASLESLMALKAEVIGLRPRLRDYYDLYVLAREFGLRRIIREATLRIPAFNDSLFMQQLVYMGDVQEKALDAKLEPKERVTAEEILDFFRRATADLIDPHRDPPAPPGIPGAPQG